MGNSKNTSCDWVLGCRLEAQVQSGVLEKTSVFREVLAPGMTASWASSRCFSQVSSPVTPRLVCDEHCSEVEDVVAHVLSDKWGCISELLTCPLWKLLLFGV